MSGPSAEAGTKSVRIEEYRRGWRIQLLATLGLTVQATTPPFYAFSTLVGPLHEAFGWAKADIPIAVTFMFLGAVIGFPAGGWLMRKFDARFLAVCSMLALSGWLLLMSRMDLFGQSVWLLYIGYFGLAIVGMGATQVVWTTITGYWFSANRGLALAVTMSGTGLGSLIAPPVIGYVVQEWSWRAGFIVLALFPLVVLPLVWRWFALTPDEPEADRQSGLHVHSHGDLPAVPGMTVREGLLSWRFWLIGFAMALIAMNIVAFLVSAVPILEERNIAPMQAAVMMSAYAVPMILGRIVTGALIDRIWAPAVSAVSLALPAFACLIFLNTTSVSMLVLAIMMIGFGTGAEADLAAFLVARYCGMRDYAPLIGVQWGLVLALDCLGPLWAKLLYELGGSHDLFLSLAGGIFLVCALAPLLLGRYPDFKGGRKAMPEL